MYLRSSRFFQFSAVWLQSCEKSTTSQKHFGFTNIGSKVHTFVDNFHLECLCTLSKGGKFTKFQGESDNKH